MAFRCSFSLCREGEKWARGSAGLGIERSVGSLGMERALDGGDGRLKLAAETMKGRGAGALLMGTNSSRYSESRELAINSSSPLGIPIHVRASGKCTAALRVLWDEHAKIKEHSKEKNEMHDVDVCHEEDASHLLQSNEVQLMEASCRDVKKHHLEAAVDLLDDFPILLIKSDVGDVIDALSPFEENLTKRVKISALQQMRHYPMEDMVDDGYSLILSFQTLDVAALIQAFFPRMQPGSVMNV
ncbi:hypothetical protein EJB05_02927, partial [Eragrostis curvula]